MEIKDIIKQRRLELGYTLDDVSKLIGVTSATISRWESGEIANMRRDKIVKLAEALKISPSVIMGWDAYENMESQYYLDDDVKDLAEFMFENPEYKVLFDASRNVSKDDIEFVKEMIDRVSNNSD